jgi:hypothetical protein
MAAGPRSKPLRGYRRLPGHKYRTPRGKVITEYEYRSRKARRSGFRNYTQQRRLRETPEFRKLSFDIKSARPSADLSSGGDVEREISELLKHREAVGGGQPGTGGMIGEPGERFKRLQERLGLEPWFVWRFWYSEVRFG